MKINRNKIVEVCRFFLLSTVIISGLLCIIATGGGDGSSGASVSPPVISDLTINGSSEDGLMLDYNTVAEYEVTTPGSG